MQTVAPNTAYVLETELEWLIYQLWSKSTARAPQFSFSIADTVIMRQGVPQTWYFSSKEGYILKKNFQNVKLSKINKTFNKKNGMSLNATLDLPAATAYSYKPQRNNQTGDERMSLRIGYVSGRDLYYFMKSCGNNTVMEGRPHVLQAFVSPRLIHNSVIQVQWTPGSLQMQKITNKMPIVEQRNPIDVRSVTAEDQQEGQYTETVELENMGPIFESILRAMSEIQGHIKKNSDIVISAGNFYFKINEGEQPVLVFASMIKSERPILVLNSTINFALMLQEYNLPSQNRYETRSNQPVLSSASMSNRTLQQNLARGTAPDLFSSGSQDNHYHIAGRASGAHGMMKSSRVKSAMPPKKTYKFGNPAGLKQQQQQRKQATTQCAFCPDQVTLMHSYELTVNQIIKLYEYFEQSPSGLLLLTVSSARQQKFYEDIYAEVVASSAKTRQWLKENLSEGGTNGIQAANLDVQIPMPLRRAFNLNGKTKYTMLKHDPNFLFKALQICPHCYEYIKAMLALQGTEERQMVHKSQDQIKTTTNYSSILNKASAPMAITQAWAQNQKPKTAGYLLEDQNSKVKATDESFNTEIGSLVDPKKENEQEVMAKISQLCTNAQAQAIETTDMNKRRQSLMQDSVIGNDEALSLNINPSTMKSTQNSMQLPQGRGQDRSPLDSNNHMQTTKSMRSANATEHMNDSIINFVKSNGLNAVENQQNSQTKAMKNTWHRAKPASAKPRQNHAQFNIADKKYLRDARMKLDKKVLKDESIKFKAQMFDQHRVLMTQPGMIDPTQRSLTITQSQNNFFYGHSPSSQPNLFVQPQKRISIVGPGVENRKMRPISAHPAFGAAVAKPGDLGEYMPSFNKLTLQPSDYGMSQSPYNAMMQAQQDDQSSSLFLYTKYDAARIYLNSVNKNDINIHKEFKNVKSKGSLHHPHTTTAASATSKPPMNKQSRRKSAKGGAPPQQRNDQVNGQKAAYPQSLAKMRSPPHKMTTKWQNQEIARLQQRLNAQSMDMFNYQSGISSTNVVHMPTNIVVPSTLQSEEKTVSDTDAPDQLQQPPIQGGLAASLLNLQEMEMTDIDQIAANADNLIEILQSIKQAKSNQLAGEELGETPGFPGTQKPSLEPQTAPPALRPQTEQPGLSAAVAPADFWDNHTRSQLQQNQSNQNQLLQEAASKASAEYDVLPAAKAEDLWDDNGVEREPLEESGDTTGAILVEEEMKQRNNDESGDFWNSPKKTDKSNSQSHSKKPSTQASIKRAKTGWEKKQSGSVAADQKKRLSNLSSSNVEQRNHQSKNASRIGTNHDLVVDGIQIQAESDRRLSRERINMEEVELNSNSSFEKESDTLAIQKVIKKGASNVKVSNSMGLQSQETRKFVKNETSFVEVKESNDHIPNVKYSQPPSVYSSQVEKKPSHHSVVSEATVQFSGNALDNSIPENLIDKIAEIVNQKVQQELLKQSQEEVKPQQAKKYETQAREAALRQSSSNQILDESSIREDLISEAFDTQGKQQPPFDLDSNPNFEPESIQEMPDLSPVPLNANHKAQGHATADPKFIKNASAASVLPFEDQKQNTATDGGTSQMYSSIQDTTTQQHAVTATQNQITQMQQSPMAMVAQPADLNSTVYTAIEDSANVLPAVRVGQDDLEESGQIVEESGQIMDTTSEYKSVKASSAQDYDDISVTNQTVNSSQKPKFTIY